MNSKNRACALLLSTALPVFAPGFAMAQASIVQAPTVVQEIVVTAQKRTERLQDVPIAISVISGKNLQKRDITAATQLQNITPELTFTGVPSNFSIRGLGTQTFTRSAESGVGMVLDGVVLGQNVASTNSLFDLDHVEVLDGPQGMLFGKSASAGVINIITNSPKLGQYQFAGHVDEGGDGYQVYQGVANIPINDVTALRLTAFDSNFTGQIKNIFNGDTEGTTQNAGVRGSLLYQPNDSFRLIVRGDYERDTGDPSVDTTAVATGAHLAALQACGVTPGFGNRQVCFAGPYANLEEFYGMSAQADWTVNHFTLTSITSGRTFVQKDDLDAGQQVQDLLANNRAEVNTHQFSEELRLASPTGQRLEYVGGLYFFDLSGSPSSNFSNQGGTFAITPSTVLDRVSRFDTQQVSYAVFGQATFHLTDKVNLIAGARETFDDTKGGTGTSCNPADGDCSSPLEALIVTISPQPVPVKVQTDNFSYRVGTQYKFDPNNMVYLTYTLGYKGAAVNNVVAGSPAPAVVQPEIPHDLEGGYKMTLLDHRLTLNLSAFYDKVDDFQANVFTVTGPTTSAFVFSNASYLVAKGAEVSFSAQPMQGLSVSGGVIYNNATYGSFIVQCDGAYTSPCTTVNGKKVVNAEGRQLAGAPLWKMDLVAEYDHPIGNAEGFITSDANYRTDVSSSVPLDPNEIIKAYALVNGRIGLRFRGGRYSVALFAKNLFDKRVIDTISPDFIQTNGNYIHFFDPNSYRVIGISLDARY